MVNYFSPKGLQRHIEIIRELERKLSEIEKQVGEATSQGGETWHDNAPYEAVKHDIGIQNQLLRNAQSMVSWAHVKRYPKVLDDPIVQYGTQVTLTLNGRRSMYAIVGYGDADIDKNWILYESPLAQALMGHHEGDAFIETINKRDVQIQIESVTTLTDPELKD